MPRRHDPDGTDDNDNRHADGVNGVDDFRIPVSSFGHVHEHDQLQSCLNEGKAADYRPFQGGGPTGPQNDQCSQERQSDPQQKSDNMKDRDIP